MHPIFFQHSEFNLQPPPPSPRKLQNDLRISTPKKFFSPNPRIINLLQKYFHSNHFAHLRKRPPCHNQPAPHPTGVHASTCLPQTNKKTNSNPIHTPPTTPLPSPPTCIPPTLSLE